jgi:hypothetical protein
MSNQVCIKCHKPATKVYRPDMDLNGIGMCDEHEEEIRKDLMIAMFTDWKYFEDKYLKEPKKKKT